MTLPYELYTVEQLKAIEQLAYENIPPFTLMERAGKAAFDALMHHVESTFPIYVFCGGGNNGGDGLVVARLAHEQGLTVCAVLLSTPEQLPEEALIAYQQAKNAEVDIVSFDEDLSLDENSIVVDALLGIGIKGDVRGKYQTAIACINASGSFVFSLDVPSGIDADKGCVLGEAVVADVTISFIGLTQGLVTGEAVDYCGELLVDELGLEEEFESVAVNALLVDEHDLLDYYAPRIKSTHKGEMGHVLIIGGNYGMAGAARLAAEAALRAGTGLVSVATRPEHVGIILSGRPEIMCHGIENVDALSPLLTKATVVVVGPGLGQCDFAKALFALAMSFDGPKVIDADALTLLEKEKKCPNDCVLTPHPGEAAMLLDSDAKTIQKNRFQAALSLQKKFDGVIVLKGAGTIIQAADELPHICAVGNPGMATAGMGDVLSGIIAGFLAQKEALFDAAIAGTLLHGASADKACAQLGEKSLLASDLFAFMPEVIKSLTDHDIKWEDV